MILYTGVCVSGVGADTESQVRIDCGSISGDKFLSGALLLLPFFLSLTPHVGFRIWI